MAAGYKSPLFLFGIGEGPVGTGFASPFFPLGLFSPAAGTPDTGGAVSFYGWWLGGFSGYEASANSPWFFLKKGRQRRNE